MMEALALWPFGQAQVLFFAAVLYIVEPNDAIDTLPTSIWLCIVTVTTVGYGASLSGTRAVDNNTRTTVDCIQQLSIYLWVCRLVRSCILESSVCRSVHLAAFLAACLLACLSLSFLFCLSLFVSLSSLYLPLHAHWASAREPNNNHPTWPGDVAPSTWPGRIVAGTLCFISVLFMAMPLSATLMQATCASPRSISLMILLCKMQPRF